MPAFGPWELLIIFLIVFLLFGARRVADIGGAMGKSIRDFRRAVNDDAPTSAAQSTTKRADQ